jgi:cyclophilin family peptidyl-prolyl cis-trans isomerase
MLSSSQFPVAFSFSLLLICAATIGHSAQADNPEEPVVVLETSLGTMVFQFFPDEAPKTTDNFKRLVQEGFYDGKPFYRVVKGHVIQTGDGGENDQPTVPGEFDAYPHVTGALGLARGDDPDSGSTEIYICNAPRPHLDGRYAVFGLLVEGFDVLEKISNVPVNEKWVGSEGTIAFHEPVKPVLIIRASIELRALPKMVAQQ